MENMKLKLANNLLIEIDAVKECADVSGSLVLIEMITKDALQLAEMVRKDENRKIDMEKTLLIDDMREIDADVIARTFEAGIHALKELGPFSKMYLDHDLGDDIMANTGYGIMNFLEANPQYLPKEIVLVTSNPVGRRQMEVVINRLYGNKE